jgi:hypothetical protein
VEFFVVEVVEMVAVVIMAVLAVVVGHPQNGRCVRFVRRSVTLLEGAGKGLTVISSWKINLQILHQTPFDHPIVWIPIGIPTLEPLII